MAIADVLAIVASLIALGIGFPSLLTLLSLLFPVAVDRAREEIHLRPGRSIVRGLAGFFGLVILGAIVRQAAGIGQLLALLTLLSGLSVMMIGATGMARSLALSLRGHCGEQSKTHDALVGAVVIEFAAVVPLVGWFVVLPLSCLAMLGAGFSALFTRKGRQQGEAQPAVGVAAQS